MFGRVYRRYVLAALTVVYGLNYLDRSLVTLLLQPIKIDLHLSDTELGILTGIAFGLFYATLGLPIARWADRGNRVTIASFSIGLWGVTVMLCLLVQNFAQLVLARVAAAVGEAGCMPPTYSLLGDYFPGASERTRAMSIFLLGSPLAFLVSFLTGGYLNQHFGWRIAFFVMGVPGLLVAALVKLTIAEPRTVASDDRSNGENHLPSMVAVFVFLWQQGASRNLSMGLILLCTMGLGLSPWYASFLMRSHNMNTAELGVWLGLIFGIGGIGGILLGGFVSERWFTNDERGQMRLSAILVASLVPGLVLFLLLPQKYPALLMLLVVVLGSNFVFGPTFALLQRLVPDQMRATTLAIVMLFVNLIGMGVGPFIVGVISDALNPILGIGSLRYAMLVMSFVSLWSAIHFWAVGNTVSAEIAAAGRKNAVTDRETWLFAEVKT